MVTTTKPKPTTTSKPKPKPKPKGGGSAQARATANLTRDYATGEAEANKLYAPGSLGRESTQPAIAKVSTSMAGGSQSIAQAEQNYTDESQHDAMVQAALQTLQAQTLGIDEPGNNALRSSGTRAIKQTAATDARSLRTAQATEGVSGASAIGQMLGQQRNTEAQLRNFETDLLAKNVDFKQTAATNFASAATSAADQYSNQRDKALAILMGARKDSSDYTANAEATNAGIDEKNIGIAQGTEQYNNTQAEKEKAGYAGVKYGQAGVENSYRTQEQTLDLMRQQLKAAGIGGGTPRRTAPKPNGARK